MYKIFSFFVVIMLSFACLGQTIKTNRRANNKHLSKQNSDACTNLDVHQFLIGMEIGDKYTDSIFFLNYKWKDIELNSNPVEFQLGSLEVSPTFSEIDSFSSRYYGTSKKCRFLRISFALNKYYQPIFYFSPVLMEFEGNVPDNTMSYFRIPDDSPSDTFFTWNYEWIGHTAAEAHDDMERYKNSIYKNDISGQFVQLDETDPESVIFPLVEISDIVNANIGTSNRFASTRFAEKTKGTKLTFRWAAELDDKNILRNAVIMTPYLVHGPVENAGPGTEMAGNFQTACPPNCKEVKYKTSSK